MKAIVSAFGWPLKRMVGSDGARAAWLLVQHADHDVEFQHKCLELMKPHEGTGEANPGDIAYLTDRVLVNEGEMQVYGTQFHEVDGVRQPWPIRNPEQVDVRRNAKGLKTLKDYAEFMNT